MSEYGEERENKNFISGEKFCVDDYDDYDDYEYNDEGLQITTGSESNCQKPTLVIMIGNVQTIIMMSRKRKATPLQ